METNPDPTTVTIEFVDGHRLQPFLPIIMIFAILGVLTVLCSLIYASYCLWRTFCRRQSFDYYDDKRRGSSSVMSHIIPWLSIPSPTDTRRPSWFSQLIQRTSDDRRRPSCFRKPDDRRPSLLSQILNRDTTTFVPIDASIKLVPREEILSDPTRRRGVDELEIWQRKQSTSTQGSLKPSPLVWKFPLDDGAYPDSPESVGHRRFSMQENPSLPSLGHDTIQMYRSQSEKTNTKLDGSILIDPSNTPNSIKVKLPKPKPIQNSDIRLVRKELEESKLKNSSSQWLYPSDSRSL